MMVGGLIQGTERELLGSLVLALQQPSEAEAQPGGLPLVATHRKPISYHTVFRIQTLDLLPS